MSAENGHQQGEQGITLMIDNYDSFTYNIVQYLAQLGANGTTLAARIPTSVDAAVQPVALTACRSYL